MFYSKMKRGFSESLESVFFVIDCEIKGKISELII